jgi:hypothetical protein
VISNGSNLYVRYATGMYFHVYPLNSVNSLHMHVVNIAHKGPALKHHAHKNMPLAAVGGCTRCTQV